MGTFTFFASFVFVLWIWWPDMFGKTAAETVKAYRTALQESET